MNNLQPTPKRNYIVEPILIVQKPFDKSYDFDLQMIYEKFFKHANCKQFYQLSNFYSAFDALLTSGDTNGQSISIPIEFKKRPDTDVWRFADKGAMFERPKYDSLLQIKELTNAPAAFYIMMFNDAILIWNVKKDPNLEWVSECQLVDNSGIKEYKMKEVTYLPYSSACYIISTHSWELRTYTALCDYIKREQMKYNGE